MAELSEVDAGSTEAPVGSLWSILQRGTDLNPDNTALVAPAQPANHLQGLVGPAPTSSGGDLLELPGSASSPTHCLTWSFTQLWRAAARLASVLDANHIMPGATILVLVPSCAEWALMLWVSALRCYTLVTLDTKVLKPGHEQMLHGYIERLAPSVIMVRSQDDAVAVDCCRGKNRGPFMGLTLSFLAEPLSGWTSMSDISFMSFPDNIKAVPVLDNLDRVAIIIFTSGTSTGTPKGCLRTVGELLRTFALTLGSPPGPPFVLANTQNYMGAPYLLYWSWHAGNAVILPGGEFSTTTTLSAITTYPSMTIILDLLRMSLIAGHADYSREKVRSVRYILVSFSVTTVGALRRAQEMFPNAEICATYGMTEASYLFGWPQGPPKPQDIPSFQGVAASGTALPGIKLKVVDDNGHVVRRNEPGILHLSSERVTKGYLESVRVEAFYEENGSSWYITGDYAVLDDRGRIYILGRSEDMIRTDGITIAPATIENVLTTFSKSMVCVPLPALSLFQYAVF